MEQRINSPFQLPRERDNRERAHSGDAPGFTVTHQTLKGTVAAPHPHKPGGEESASTEMLTVALASLIFDTLCITLPVINILLFSYRLRLRLPHRAGNATSTRSLKRHQKGPQPGAPFASSKRETPSD